MFVPLEPKIADGSAENTVQVRCDVACCNYPPAMHFLKMVASAARDPGSFIQVNESNAGLSSSTIVFADGQSITQLDAALRRESIDTPTLSTPIDRLSPVEGVSVQPVVRHDLAQSAIAGPHRPRKTQRPSVPEFPQHAKKTELRWKTDTQDTVSHSAAPIDLTPVRREHEISSPADRIATYRTYSQNASTLSAPPPATWNQSLLESARRRDWIWPKVVDELIGREWNSINQLGRTALGNSRDETRRVLVTSVNRGEGRTTIALALARWAAMTGHRTLLVDADVRQPGIATALHLLATGDWRTNSLAFTIDNLIVSCRSLPLGLLPSAANTRLETGPAAIEQLIMQLAVAEQEFDCCIIDAGPVEVLCQQVATVTRLSSSIVIVNPHHRGVSPHLISACNTLWQMGKPAVAIADNFQR